MGVSRLCVIVKDEPEAVPLAHDAPLPPLPEVACVSPAMTPPEIIKA